MNVVITGGTGFVGSALTSRLLELGHKVTITGRRPKNPLPSHPGLRYLSADTTLPGSWQSDISGHDAYINLAGRSVFNYWTKSYKQHIYESRILTTRNLVRAIDTPAAVLLSASAAGYYGDGGEEEKEETASCGNDFLAEVCRDWEGEALKAQEKGCRVVLMRFGVILGKGGGAAKTMKLPFKLGLGGAIGSGMQWFPWIHIADVVNAINFLLLADGLHGAFNFSAPESVRQKEFARKLGKTFNRPALLPTPAFIMKTALGEFGGSLLQGQKVIPAALQQNGFTFSYPKLASALTHIFHD